MLDRFQSIDFGLLGLKPGSRVLDLGCGTGRHTLEASKHPGRVYGVDLLGGDILRARYLLEIMRRRANRPTAPGRPEAEAGAGPLPVD